MPLLSMFITKKIGVFLREYAVFLVLAVELHRIHRNTIVSYFIMKMRSGGIACGAYISDYLALSNILTVAYNHIAHMSVSCCIAVLMVDKYAKTISLAPT